MDFQRFPSNLNTHPHQNANGPHCLGTLCHVLSSFSASTPLVVPHVEMSSVVFM
jgi:hypothetical protein